MKRIELLKELFFKLHSDGLTFSSIARELNVTVSEVSVFAKERNIKSNFKYDDANFKQQFIDVYNQGLNDSEISLKIGKSVSAVQAYRKKLNLDKNRKHKIKLSDLTAVELGMLIGGLLGDSYIQPVRKSSNGGFTHSVKQEDYFMWKYNMLQRLCNKIIYSSQVHKKTKRTYYKVSTKFKAGEYLDNLMSIFYLDRVKNIPNFEFIEQHFNDYSLAVWFGDDGSKQTIATLGFPSNTVLKLAELLENKYQIHTRITSHNDIYINKQANSAIAEIIKPILPESMHYKFY